MKRLNVYIAYGFLLVPVFLCLLIGLANFLLPRELELPSSSAIWKACIELLAQQETFDALFETFVRVFIAAIFSLIGGLFFGLLFGSSRLIWTLSQPSVDFFRSIPVTFLIPCVSLLIGSTSAQIVLILATYPSLLIIMLSVRYAISKQLDERILSFSIMSGSTSKVKRFFAMTSYEILPELVAAFRVCLSYCIVVVTVLEYMRVGNKRGIGGLISDELQNLNYQSVYALTFILGVVGFLMNKGIELFQYRFVHWSFKQNSL